MAIEQFPDSKSRSISEPALVSPGMWLLSFAIYCGIGLALHALFVGARFDWTSAWTLIWLFGWPIMLLTASVMLLCSLVISIVIVAICWAFFGAIAEDLRNESHQRRFT
jgi:hypothetical protein